MAIKTIALQELRLGPYAPGIQSRLNTLEADRFSSRLWRRDAGLWKSDPKEAESIRNALGWLAVADRMQEELGGLLRFRDEIRAAGFRHVVHMGMGGSSLAPLALQQLFPSEPQGLPLTVLDTTDPETIRKIERAVPLGETVFIVASKSGTTAEPLAFGEYFFAGVRELKGARAGENFVAITDPGTPLVQLAKERGFRRVFSGLPDIGGRYSALSPFGVVPAVLLGIDVAEGLRRALRMAEECGPETPIAENPGVVLGAVLGELARRGRNKVTFLVPDSLSTFALWLEQLLAESTGKEGTGVLPVAGEKAGPPSVYGDDRLFIHIGLPGTPDPLLERAVADLEKAGQPVVALRMEDRLDIFREFFRWEVATATAGAVLGINPFDQPNVQESKEITNRFLKMLVQSGKLPEPAPSLREEPLRFFGAQAAASGKELLKGFFAQARPGDYVSLQAYLPETPETDETLQGIQAELRDRLRLAATAGYGPRFLHSTGQFHKGGPNTGFFLQLTADDREDGPIPGAPYSFGLLKRAQALGDLEALRRHGRRVLRIHLGADVRNGLQILRKTLADALSEGKRP